jgi:site-specific recombinase XerD
MLAGLPDTLLGCRDRALLLVGFAGAFRRSELVALHLEDIESSREGLTITVRRSKPTRMGREQRSALPTLGKRRTARCGRTNRECPVSRLDFQICSIESSSTRANDAFNIPPL